ncbi:hypothetical protein [Nostoc punctiforme]|uniref:Uncharacterized protein n=2 Tax=Nostoc punctiforme TaxID=272131 RepID=B2ITF5_NOSP7|nr:hypothetical protein [Nostoc punctiforme]ACC81186.1 hypothetical protein Npun_R2632 [Nostoc punctiforme PCC 73102]RCJ41050.1 hypothetical protein A6769_38990 [Nostoc punctiforme NIES-2108]
MTTEIKLGFCKAPEPIYLYIKSGEMEGNGYTWYYYDFDKEKITPEYNTGLCGYLSELRLTSREFKGKENVKLDIVINSNETYIIRTGVETNFAKTFLLAIALVEDLTKPLIIGCAAGEENVVFCRVYDATTKSRVKAEWNPSADWAGIIQDTKARLEGNNAPPSLVKSQPPKASRETLLAESDRLIADLNWSASQGKEYLLKNYSKVGRSLLTDAELLDFVGKLQKNFDV